MINNELKGLNGLLLLVRAVAGLLPLNQNSQKQGTCNVFVPCLLVHKSKDTSSRLQTELSHFASKVFHLFK